MNLSELRFRPNPAIFQLMQLKKYRFGGSVIDTFDRELAFLEYQRCENLLIDKLSTKKILEDDNLPAALNKRLYYVAAGIEKLEEKIKPDLIQAAEDIIRDIYGIPEHIKCSGDICSNIQLNPVAGDDDIISQMPDDFDEQVKKRLLLNFIPHGSTMHVWKTAHHLIRKNISDNLFKLYEEYAAIVSWMLWQLHPISFSKTIGSAGAGVQGKSQVRFNRPGDGGATIEAQATNFPVMLHEFNKGVMDYLICDGLPTHYSPQQLEALYSHADEHSLEPWYYYLSPGIWQRILQKENVASTELPAIVKKISGKNLLEIEKYFLSLSHEV